MHRSAVFAGSGAVEVDHAKRTAHDRHGRRQSRAVQAASQAVGGVLGGADRSRRRRKARPAQVPEPTPVNKCGGLSRAF